jgi:2-polyprenyl-6-methoxyphenol hydroxylase-like FAD-dependent oxidoreductase
VDFDVAILGGGPTGLSLANLLGVMGVRAVLILQTGKAWRAGSWRERG